MDYDIHPKAGKALDLSGAFLFVVFGVVALIFSNFILVAGSFLAVMAALASYLAWGKMEGGDDLGFIGYRRLCIILACAAGIVIALGIVSGVLA